MQYTKMDYTKLTDQELETEQDSHDKAFNALVEAIEAIRKAQSHHEDRWNKMSEESRQRNILKCQRMPESMRLAAQVEEIGLTVPPMVRSKLQRIADEVRKL